MKALVADDEAPARRRLTRLLEQLEGVRVVAEVGTGLEVLAALEREQADVLLLDIDMPELSGLELAARFTQLPPIIFVTAHDEHALRAFEVGAVDYVLKPVELERLSAALSRVQQRGGGAAPALETLRKVRGDGVPRVVAHDRGTLLMFDARTIDRFHAAEKYTSFLAEGREHLTEEPLSALEQRLQEFGFLRVHRSELVRLAAVRALTARTGEHEVRLADGQTVQVSRRFLADLRRALGLL